MASGEGVVELNKEQLLRLSEIMHDMEFEQIRQIPFDFEGERNKHFDTCHNNHETIKRLLESEKKEGIIDERLYEAWHLVWEFLKGTINFGLQAINSYSVRVELLEKMIAHCDYSLEVLQKIDPENVDVVRRFTKDAQKFKEVINSINRRHRNPVSRAFSSGLQRKGVGYKELVERYMDKRGMEGSFEDLAPAEKYMLSQEIIIDSGRGSEMIDEAFASARKELFTGFALIAFVAAITVFDILLDPSTPVMVRMIKTVKDFAASIAGSTLGHMAENAMKETAWAALVAEEAVIDLFAVAGFVIGVGIGVVLAVLGEFLIDAIFSSGGKHHQNAHQTPVHFATLPDGLALAREIYNS